MAAPHQLLRVLIVRHGETASNASGIIQGQLDIPLNAKGYLQAYYTAHALAHEHIDEVYTSPLQRARDTALTIVRYHPSLRVASAATAEDERKQLLEAQGTPGTLTPSGRVATDARLMERNLGELQGKPGAGRAHGDIPGAETTDALRKRLIGFWDDMTAHPLEPFASATSSSGASTPAQASGVNTPTRALDHTEYTLPPPPPAALEAVQERPQKIPRPGKTFARTVVLVSHGAAMRNLVAANLLHFGAIQLNPELQAAYDAGAAVGTKGRFANCSITEIHWPLGLDVFDAMSGKVASGAAHGTLVRWSDVHHLPSELEKQLVDNVDEVEEDEDESAPAKA